MGRETHSQLDKEARDRIALYVVDSMRVNEASRFEEHLGRCTACREEVARLKPVVADLVLAGPHTNPPAGLKERVLERAKQRSFALLPAASQDWHATGVSGAEIAQLWSDTTSARHTLLLRMEAGTRIPTHHHAGSEECFVVNHKGKLRPTGGFSLFGWRNGQLVDPSGAIRALDADAFPGAEASIQCGSNDCRFEGQASNRSREPAEWIAVFSGENFLHAHRTQGSDFRFSVPGEIVGPDLEENLRVFAVPASGSAAEI